MYCPSGARRIVVMAGATKLWPLTGLAGSCSWYGYVCMKNQTELRTHKKDQAVHLNIEIEFEY